jgi:galactose mutarotase-like enzyme
LGKEKSRFTLSEYQQKKKVSQVVDVVGNEQLLDQYFPFDFRWSCMYRLDKEGLNIFCELLKDHVEKKKNQASGIKQI